MTTSDIFLERYNTILSLIEDQRQHFFIIATFTSNARSNIKVWRNKGVNKETSFSMLLCLNIAHLNGIVKYGAILLILKLQMVTFFIAWWSYAWYYACCTLTVWSIILSGVISSAIFNFDVWINPKLQHVKRGVIAFEAGDGLICWQSMNK